MILIDAEKLKLAIRDDPEIDGQNFARMKMHIEETAVAYKLSPTNADRIRAMSDEELAEFLILSPEMEFDVCLLCKFGNPTPRDDRGQCLSGHGVCEVKLRAEAFKEWLKQTVGDDNG